MLEKLTQHDFSRSLLQHNQDFYRFIRNGVPVEWRDEAGVAKHGTATVIDFRNPDNNRFLAAAVAARGWEARLVEHRDAHNWISWRDALHPHLAELVLRAV